MATIGMSTEPALDVEQRGRRIDLSKRRRIAWLSDSDEASAQAVGNRKLGFRVFLAAKADVMDAPAAARQRGQRVDGGLCAAEFVDKGPERRRTDILAPDEPEPGKTLTVAQTRRRLRGRSGLSASFCQCASPRLA